METHGEQSKSGEIMLESLLIMVPMFFILLFLISLTFLLHQHFTMVTIANETAAKIGQTYKLLNSDPVTGYTDVEALKAIRPYRSVKSDEYALANQHKSASFASWRLNKASFAKKSSGSAGPDIYAVVSKDGLGRGHVTVKISGEYAIFLGEVLDYFGLAGKRQFQAVGTAECLDLIDYLNAVDASHALLNLPMGKSELVKMFNKWLKVLFG